MIYLGYGSGIVVKGKTGKFITERLVNSLLCKLHFTRLFSVVAIVMHVQVQSISLLSVIA